MIEAAGQATPAEAVRRCLNYTEQAEEKVGAVVRGCNSHGQFCCCQCCSGCCSCDIVGEVR